MFSGDHGVRAADRGRQADADATAFLSGYGRRQILSEHRLAISHCMAVGRLGERLGYHLQRIELRIVIETMIMLLMAAMVR